MTTVYQPTQRQSRTAASKRLHRADWLTVAILILSTALSYSLIVGNWMYQSDLKTGLLWNLFLAWIPMLIAFIIRVVRPNLLFLPPLLIGWLLFFPNALYIFTDLIHISWLDTTGLWLDFLTILSASFTGLIAGLASLSWVQVTVEEKLGRIIAWLFVIGSLSASGPGIYIGRFLHWNSWDVITDPRTILTTLEPILTNEWELFRMVIFSAVLALIFLFVYVMMFTLPMANRD